MLKDAHDGRVIRTESVPKDQDVSITTAAPSVFAKFGQIDSKTLIAKLQSLRDNAYCEYIGCCRQEDCLGWEAKVDTGIFGLKELEAHKKAAEALGKHRAYSRIIEDLMLQTQPPIAY